MNHKTVIKRMLSKFGLRITHAQENRFSGTHTALSDLAKRGYAPKVIIDVGANMGQWANIARECFPAAHMHFIEPQPLCFAALFSRLKTTLHPMAVSSPGVRERGFSGSGTGCHVSDNADRNFVTTTIDEMMSKTPVSIHDRAMLKLDIEGHEIEALKGGLTTLGNSEVVFIEFWLFHRHDKKSLPVFRDIMALMTEHNFVLYDFAGLAGRSSDKRLRSGDAIFVRRDSKLLDDDSW